MRGMAVILSVRSDWTHDGLAVHLVHGQDDPISFAVQHIVIDPRDLPILAKFRSEVGDWPILSSR